MRLVIVLGLKCITKQMKVSTNIMRQSHLHPESPFSARGTAGAARHVEI